MLRTVTVQSWATDPRPRVPTFGRILEVPARSGRALRASPLRASGTRRDPVRAGRLLESAAPTPQQLDRCRVPPSDATRTQTRGHHPARRLDLGNEGWPALRAVPEDPPAVSALVLNRPLQTASADLAPPCLPPTAAPRPSPHDLPTSPLVSPRDHRSTCPVGAGSGLPPPGLLPAERPGRGSESRSERSETAQRRRRRP